MTDHGGAWVAQSVKSLTLDFGSDHDLRVVGSSPTWGWALSAKSASPSPPALSLSDINKLKLRKKSQTKALNNAQNYTSKRLLKNFLDMYYITRLSFFLMLRKTTEKLLSFNSSVSYLIKII